MSVRLWIAPFVLGAGVVASPVVAPPAASRADAAAQDPAPRTIQDQTTIDDQVDKFRWCAGALPANRIERIVEATLALDTLERASELADLIEAPV